MASVSGFTKEEFEAMIGEVIVGVRIIGGEQLIFKTQSGKEFDGGNVRGITESNPTAAALPSTASGTITSTNVQSALAEIDTELTALNTGKLKRTQVKKILCGVVRHPGGTYDADAFPIHQYEDFLNVFPAGYFNFAPEVLITPIKTSLPNEILPGWSVAAISTRSFRIWAGAFTQNAGGFVTPLPIDFHYVATANEFFT